MKPIQECTTVAELLEDPKRWCQDESALDSNGDWTNAKSQSAVRWCLIGAIERIYKNYTSNNRETICQIHLKISKLLGVSIVSYNDDPIRTHAEVLEVAKVLGI